MTYSIVLKYTFQQDCCVLAIFSDAQTNIIQKTRKWRSAAIGNNNNLIEKNKNLIAINTNYAMRKIYA